MDSLREMEVADDYVLIAYHTQPVLFFAEAVALSREQPGVSIEEIGKCFRAQFDEAELSSLIHELNKPKL